MQNVVSYEKNNGVAIIQYDNPPLNILTIENLEIVNETIKQAELDNEVNVIILTMKRQGKVFCAGMHLDEMLASKDTANGIKGYCDHSKEIFYITTHCKACYLCI